ncbi:MAG TPA: hypothetical protein VG319_01875 [Polyangia bacterium]|nr:hypothetical protein [Polyangia bacterium]
MPGLAVTLALVLAAAADGGASSSAAPAPSMPPSLLLPVAPPSRTAPADRSYELHRAKDGTGELIYEGPGFTARIARDGTTRFRDKRLTLLRPWSFLPFAPLPLPAGRATLQSTFGDLLARRAPRRGSPADADPPAQSLPLLPRMSPDRPDPQEACTYPRACYFEAQVVLIGIGGTFDLTDELLRLGGEDPYRRDKAHFLAATRDLRSRLAGRALAEGLRSAAAALPERLESIACDARRTVRERRAIIEALRQEIDGDTAAARDAAATIARFVETRFDGADGGVSCPR